MAGNYPDVPAPRMAFDRDGSLGAVLAGGVVTPQDASWLQTLNNENEDSIGRPGYVIIIFPELRDIKGYFFAGYIIDDAFGDWGPIQTSVDTTTGLDGTWVTQESVPAPGLGTWAVVPDYRTRIHTVDWPGVKAVRVYAYNGYDMQLRAWHLYGNVHAGETPDRLRLWHPTLDEEVGGAYFDWGNVPQNSTQTRPFRIKNNSSTLTAHGVIVGFDVLTDAGVPDVFTLSDGGAYGSSVTISSLAPGAISGTLSLKRTTPLTATLSIWVHRIVAQAASWS